MIGILQARGEAYSSCSEKNVNDCRHPAHRTFHPSERRKVIDNKTDGLVRQTPQAERHRRFVEKLRKGVDNLALLLARRHSGRAAPSVKNLKKRIRQNGRNLGKPTCLWRSGSCRPTTLQPGSAPRRTAPRPVSTLPVPAWLRRTAPAQCSSSFCCA